MVLAYPPLFDTLDATVVFASLFCMIAYLLICTGFADSLPGGEFCETLETPDSLPRSLGTLGTTCQAKNRHPPAKFFCLRLRVECENRDMTFRFQIEGLAW